MMVLTISGWSKYAAYYQKHLRYEYEQLMSEMPYGVFPFKKTITKYLSDFN